MNVFGIVVAAGRGKRFGGPKAAVEVGGRPMWRWAVDALEAGGVDSWTIVGEIDGGVPGGSRRRDSVVAGLGRAPDAATHVVVHDAARPLASADLVRRVIDRLRRGDVDGVIPAIPVRDTLKEVDGDVVVRTADRTNLVIVQTPQGFAIDVLKAAHAADDAEATDDAALVERFGGSVVFIAGEARNIKVTYPEDLDVIEALAK